jgi:hypothetical protein
MVANVGNTAVSLLADDKSIIEIPLDRFAGEGGAESGLV